MKILTTKLPLNLCIIILLFFNFNTIKAQSVTINQDPKFDQLLSEKRKANTSISNNNTYKIQIYNGNSDDSKKALIQFKKETKNSDATIVFSTPIYKVWVGNYKTRIEAERNLKLLKKKYPTAIIIKPSK